MNIALWIVQALLALAFLMSGGMKLMRSKYRCSPAMRKSMSLLVKAV